MAARPPIYIPPVQLAEMVVLVVVLLATVTATHVQAEQELQAKDLLVAIKVAHIIRVVVVVLVVSVQAVPHKLMVAQA